MAITVFCRTNAKMGETKMNTHFTSSEIALQEAVVNRKRDAAMASLFGIKPKHVPKLDLLFLSITTCRIYHLGKVSNLRSPWCGCEMFKNGKYVYFLYKNWICRFIRKSIEVTLHDADQYPCDDKIFDEITSKHEDFDQIQHSLRDAMIPF